MKKNIYLYELIHIHADFFPADPILICLNGLFETKKEKIKQYNDKQMELSISKYRTAT